MDRRKFLTTLIGGVAASAAVRTFPFRVFSFPTAITTATVFVPFVPEGSLFAPEMVALYMSPIGGEFRFIESLSVAEAKARYGYDWRPGYSKTQQDKQDPLRYCAPLGTPIVTGLIR